MKNLVLVLFMMFITLRGLATDIVPGVSAELARERKAAIGDVVYDLFMFLPSSPGDPCGGTVNLAFDYKGGLSDWLQIDFKGDSLIACYLNGEIVDALWEKEHILIPASKLESGENFCTLGFFSNKAALNLNPGYMYTLFVPANARTAFPCFDQPDLKGRLKLRLSMNPSWTAITSGKWISSFNPPDVLEAQFDSTEPLPTYLMSWVAGKFKQQTLKSEPWIMTVLHRETDSLKVAQLQEICDLAKESILWLEDYTGIKYPFEKYSMALLPGYQFGGMEHPGAIQYKAETMFLEPQPTPEEILSRHELIAHETAHMWFGDLVTMRWFDDVWTKEIFANFMASKMCEDAFPDIDHDLNFIRDHHTYALATDRTDGTHPISQFLNNLDQAGLLYGNIIYHKAPIMMHMLERRMGEERLRSGLQAYLNKYAWDNSSWDELVAILDSVAPDADVRSFSHAWVKEPGMPTIYVDYDKGNRKLKVRQEDPTGRGIIWPQSFTVALIGSLSDQAVQEIPVDLYSEEVTIDVPYQNIGELQAVIPNSNGDGYGYFSIKGNDEYYANWFALSPAGRYGAVLNMTEAWIRGDLASKDLTASALANIVYEQNPMVATACVDAIATLVGRGQADETLLWTALNFAQASSTKQRILRQLYGKATSSASAEQLFTIWESQSEPLLSKRDYMSMAYRLAILMPDKAQEILTSQQARLANDTDLLREFDFVSRACSADTTQLDSLFKSFLLAENRRPEPWTAKAMALLCDPAREPQCTVYLTAALDALPDIQATGDIFFPGQWLNALLGGLRSPEATQIVGDYCAALPQPLTPLNRKLLESSYLLRHCTK